jgi:short-subunit dehydrogenase
MSGQQTLLVIGATSDMARAVAQEFARNGFDIQLAARRLEDIERDAADIHNRHGVAVTVHRLDLLDYPTHPGFLSALPKLPTVVICLVGLLGDQVESEQKFDAARLIMETNYIGPASILAEVANCFEALGAGEIIGVSSVAGDRGRASNYVYGSAKAGFSAFLSGLRNRLVDRGVHVMTVKPGFVATRMTQGMELPKALTAQPERVARDIFGAYRKSRDVVYTLWPWRWVMLIIRCLPEWIFKRTKI